jgi:hypothetical protein
MNPKIGMKVVLVRLLVRENRKLVAADMGVPKLLYSSVETVDLGERNPRRTDRDEDIVDRVLPQGFPALNDSWGKTNNSASVCMCGLSSVHVDLGLMLYCGTPISVHRKSKTAG